MTEAQKQRALKWLNKLERANRLVQTALVRQIQNRAGTRAWEQSREQEDRNLIKAETAEAELRKLIEEA